MVWLTNTRVACDLIRTDDGLQIGPCSSFNTGSACSEVRNSLF